MKKFLFLLIAMMVSLASHAAMYLHYDDGTSGWDDYIPEMTQSGTTYTFTLRASTNVYFIISKSNSTDWNVFRSNNNFYYDGGANDQYNCTSGTRFQVYTYNSGSATMYIANSQLSDIEFKLETGSSNYMTVTVTPVAPTTWYLVGYPWGGKDANWEITNKNQPLTAISAKPGYYYRSGVTINSGECWKVHDGKARYSGNGSTSDDFTLAVSSTSWQNLVVNDKKAFTGTAINDGYVVVNTNVNPPQIQVTSVNPNPNYYLWTNFTSGNTWTTDVATLTNNGDGTYSTTMIVPTIMKEGYFMIGDNTSGNWTNAFRPSSGSSTEITANGTYTCDKSKNEGAWQIKKAGTYTLTLNPTTQKLTVSGFPVNAYLPHSPEDFENGEKHYFLVGTRMADFKLQPEWEFEKVEDEGGNTSYVLDKRPMYPGYFGVAVVDNYADYASHCYTFYGNNTNVTKNTSTYSLYNKGPGNGYTWTKDPVHTDHLNMKDYNGNQPAKSQDEPELPVFAKTITLNFTDGNPSGLTFDWSSNDADWLEQQTFTLVGNDYYNNSISAAEHQTLHYRKGHYDGPGWQEGYVQYDDEGNPYYDADGNLLYLTLFTKDWLKDSKVRFSTQVNSKNFTYSSDNLTFVNANSINPDDDDYYDFYFNSQTVIVNTPPAALYLVGNGFGDSWGTSNQSYPMSQLEGHEGVFYRQGTPGSYWRFHDGTTEYAGSTDYNTTLKISSGWLEVVATSNKNFEKTDITNGYVVIDTNCSPWKICVTNSNPASLSFSTPTTGKNHTTIVGQAYEWGDNITVETIQQGHNSTIEIENGWTPYVMSNVWMTDEFKIWTGWGGSKKDRYQTDCTNVENNAHWYRSNGGPNVKTPVEGANIMGPNGAVNLYNTYLDAGTEGNYKVSKQIYCERVILWFNPTQGFNNAYVEYITGTAVPTMRAYLNSQPTASEGGKIDYKWSLYNSANADDNLYVGGYEIRRFMQSTGGDIDLGLVEKVNYATTVKAKLFNSTKGSYDSTEGEYFLTFTDKGHDAEDPEKELNGLDSGVYYYKVTVYFVDNTGSDQGTRTAPSNQVPLFGPYKPTITAYQLVKLVNDGSATSGLNMMNITPTTGSEYYAIYEPSNSVKRIVEKTSDNKIKVKTYTSTADVNKFKAMMAEPKSHNWTTDYFVRTLVYEGFRNNIKQIRNADPDRITVALVDPQMNVVDTKIDGYTPVAATAYTVGDETFYGAIMPRNGKVLAPSFTSTLSYKLSDVETLTATSQRALTTPTLPQARVTGGKFQLDVEDVEDSSLNEAKGLTLSVYSVDGVSVYHKKDKGAYHLKYVADIDLNVDFGDATSTNAKATVNVQGHNPNVLGSGIDRVWDVTKDEASGRWKGTATVTFVHPASSFFPVFEDKATKFNSTSAGYGYSDSGHSATQTPNHKTRSLSNVKAEMVQTDWKPDGTKDPDGKDHNASNWALKFTSMTINDPVSSVDNPTDSFDYIYGSDGSDGKLEARYYMLEVGGTLYPYLFENFSDISDKFVTTNIADNDKSNISVKVTPIYIFRVAEDGAKGIQAKDVEVKSEVVGTLSDPVYEWPESEATEWFKNSYETAPDKLISTSNYVAYPGTPFETTIGGGDTVTYLGSIVADDADAEVEYYNLQGIRVHNPEAGRVYIRRQGANVSKVVL